MTTAVLHMSFHTPPSLSLSPLAVDAVLAVYEATSLELWSFFSYTAADGAPSHLGVAALFYLTMVFYLVIFVQVGTTQQQTSLLSLLFRVDTFICIYYITITVSCGVCVAKYISGGDHRVVC